MADWRAQLRALATVGNTDWFPLLVYAVNPPSQTTWPAELAPPSESVREFYRCCDGGYIGDHNWFPVGELLARNHRWWELQREHPRPNGGPLDAARHVILVDDVSGFPIVWDQSTDQLSIYFFKDSDELSPTGQPLDEFLHWLFGWGGPDGHWQQALRQLNERSSA